MLRSWKSSFCYLIKARCCLASAFARTVLRAWRECPSSCELSRSPQSSSGPPVAPHPASPELLAGRPLLWHLVTHRQTPTHPGSAHHFSALQGCKSNMPLVETVLWILNLDLFLIWRCVIHPLLWCWAVAATAVSQVITKGNSKHTWNHPVSMPCCFSLAGQHSINCMRYFNTYVLH